MKMAQQAVVGEKFGFWTVVGGTRSRARCKCACGTERVVIGCDLRKGKSLSCGCRVSAKQAAANFERRVHGLADSPTMTSWTEMKRRCYATHRREYLNYGARGIRVCEEWRNSFAAFVRDMGERPAGHTIERIDNQGNYEPGNCRWATRTEQERNKRSNARYVFFGVEMTVTEAAKKYNFKPSTVFNRINTLGWTPDRAVTRRVRGT